MPDGGKPSNGSDRLAAAVRDVVQRELAEGLWQMRDAAAPELRRPVFCCDLDAEGEVLAALLHDHVSPHELSQAGLLAKHFFSRFNSRVAAVLYAHPERDTAFIFDRLREVGGCGPIERDLVNLRDCQPITCRVAVQRQAVRLVELWDRRRIVAELRRVELELCHEWIGATEARARLVAL